MFDHSMFEREAVNSNGSAGFDDSVDTSQVKFRGFYADAQVSCDLLSGHVQRRSHYHFHVPLRDPWERGANSTEYIFA